MSVDANATDPDDWNEDDIWADEAALFPEDEDDFLDAPVQSTRRIEVGETESTTAPAETAVAVAASVSAAPKLTNQKGERAIAPIIASLLKAVDSGAKISSKLHAAGSQAGSRRVELSDFRTAAEDALRPLIADTNSPWFEYDLEEAAHQMLTGWTAGRREADERTALENAYRFDHLADRFKDEHPEYRWVAPRGTSDGAWYRFEADTASPNYGIYAPITDEVFANAAHSWLRADEEAAIAAGNGAKAKEAGEAIQRGVVFRMIAHLRGELSIHTELEAYDDSPFQIVDGAGIRDLQTMEVRSPSPEFLATRKLPFVGSSEAYENQKHNIEKMMGSVAPSQRPLLDAFLGTLLLQRQPISKKGLILWGPSKDNGKSTLVEAIFGVLGSSGQSAFALKAPHPMIYKENANSYAEADLDNRTCTVFDDYPKTHEVDGDKLKVFIGSGRTHQARQIHKATREVRLVHTVLLTCNDLPKLGRGEDVIERFEVILFPFKYPAENEFDAKNPWHRKRDGAFIDTVRNDPEFREAFYYYLLLRSRDWANSFGDIETSTINDDAQANKNELRHAGNNLITLLEEFAAPSPTHFVSEKDLVALLREKLKEQGMGVLSEQSLRRELGSISTLRRWGVELHTKKPRSKYKTLKHLEQSKWRASFGDGAAIAPDAANIFSGMRLKTNAYGVLLDEDEWANENGSTRAKKSVPRSAAEAEELADLAESQRA